MSNKNRRPTTEKQRQASRENGKNGLGPTSAEGKARSARNPVRHGYWARPLYPIDQGPFREDRTELQTFIDAFLGELDPGGSPILHQAALDVADKAWRVSRAQRYEACGYEGAGQARDEVRQVAVQRALAVRYRREAEIIRQLPDTAAADDEIADAFLNLSIGVGLSDEELAWIEDADVANIWKAMCTLIEEHFADREEAAAHVEARTAERNALADAIEFNIMRGVIREEMDGSFVRNAERIVSHASREYDRSLKRYWDLFERYGNPGPRLDEANDDEASDDDDHETFEGAEESCNSGDTSRHGDDNLDEDASGSRGPEEFDIWSYINADVAVDLLLNGGANTGPEPPARNEPESQDSVM